MLIDEFFFHRRRGLPVWERLGHPLDALLTMICFAFLLRAAPSMTAAKIYGALAALSMLLITKDEWVHARECSAGEHWLHAALFILHPLTLLSGAFLWPYLHGGTWPWAAWAPGNLRPPFIGVVAGVGSFSVYQLLYWNLPRD